MAIYKYKCLDCGNISEIQSTLQEKEEGKSDKFFCEKCKSHNIKPKFSVGHFIKNIFKGQDEKSCCSGSGNNENKCCCKDGKNNCCS